MFLEINVKYFFFFRFETFSQNYKKIQSFIWKTQHIIFIFEVYYYDIITFSAILIKQDKENRI